MRLQNCLILYQHPRSRDSFRVRANIVHKINLRIMFRDALLVP